MLLKFMRPFLSYFGPSFFKITLFMHHPLRAREGSTKKWTKKSAAEAMCEIDFQYLCLDSNVSRRYNTCQIKSQREAHYSILVRKVFSLCISYHQSMETGRPTIIPTRNELIKLGYLHIKSMGNDGYLYLLDQQTPLFIGKS